MPNCAVKGCNNYNRKTKGTNIRYYTFPKDKEMQDKWLTVCKNRQLINLLNACICSEHFEPDSFTKPMKHVFLNYRPKGFRDLKPDAVPTLKINVIDRNENREKQRPKWKKQSSCRKKDEKFINNFRTHEGKKSTGDSFEEVQKNRKKAAAVKQEQSGEGESKQNHPSCSSSAPSFQDVGLSSTTENTEGNITGDLNKNEGDDENSILPMEVNLDDETEEPRDAQFNDTELDAEDPLNIDNTPTSTTVIETVPTPKIISTATVVNDDKPNEQKATGQNIHVRQNLTENPAPLPVVPVNPVRKRMQLKRPLPVSDILDGYNAKVSIEDEYKNYIDEDKAFLMSLLPAMKELTGPQKMEFKMTVLNELKRIRYPSSTPTPQTVGNLTVLPYAFQPIPNLANISHVIPIQQRTINPTTLQQVINKNSSTTQQTCKILSSQPPPLAAIIPQTVSATSAETAKQKQSPTVSSTATTAATVTAKPTPVEPPAKRASVSKDNNARSQPSATETKKTTSRRTPARRKPKKQAATNETQNNTEETQIITSDLTTPQDEEETRNDGELRTEIDLDEIKIEHIKVEPYDDEDTEDAMENC
ncbi:uncharacterized protein LOC142329169 isoform X7 [Lycorma delicatula]|uniref:uncharacterized protein LOC142329169 isoform X7 n=1 Tax=Lycorma delicatula TaxID=130591 RepID=UPI003F50D9AC